MVLLNRDQEPPLSMTTVQQKPEELRGELKTKITAAVVLMSWKHLEKLVGNENNVSPFVWHLFAEVGCMLWKT